MRLAWGKGYRVVVLESNSFEAADMVMGRCDGMRDDHSIIRECKELLSRDWSLVVRHVFRELNKIVDWIARWIAEEEFRAFELDHLPQELLEMLEDEAEVREVHLSYG